MTSNKTIGFLLVVLLILVLYGLFSIASMVPSRWGITGAAAGYTNVTVGTSTAISLVVNMVDFDGNHAPSDVNDTLDNSPNPFLIRNDGNVDVNVSINATPLWDQDGYNETNQTYQIACGNSTEWNCTPLSINTFTNMPINDQAIVVIHNLTFQASSDEAEVDVNITVPPAEPDGTKSSIVTFTGTQA